MSIKTIKYVDFYNLISKDQNQKVPLRIQFKDEGELKSLKRICLSKNISFIDNVQEQINEFKEIYTLFYKQDPKSYNYFLERIKCLEANSYGDFIYLGWGEKCVINLMGEDYLYDLLCWRNKDKINEKEQAIISNKSIGIVGSSVGSFATKVLSKLGFRAFNIAELKNIKPSNSSRIYCDSVRNYGDHKLKALAESLYDYNPYIKLNLFNEGIDRRNIDDFFNFDKKKIDILIDAADDGKTKLLLREYCRIYKVPLISGFDEKGALIVIRYDDDSLLLENEFDFDSDSLDALKKINPQEYVNKLLDFFPGGKDNLSLRQKDTIIGILNKSRGGFSQLSWEAALFASCISKSTLDICLGVKISGESLIDLDSQITHHMAQDDKNELSVLI